MRAAGRAQRGGALVLQETTKYACQLASGFPQSSFDKGQLCRRKTAKRNHMAAMTPITANASTRPMNNHAPGSHLSIMVYFLRFQGVSFNAMRSCSDFSASPKPAAIARRRHNK